MKTQIQTLLLSTLLLAVFSCNDTKLDDEQITEDKKPPQVSESLTQTDSDKSVDQQIDEKWDEAKESTKKALQQSKEAGEAIWEASKESTKKMLSDSKVAGGEILDNVKEKSGEILEQSSNLLKKSNESLKELIDDKTKDENTETANDAV